ncbi:MAG: hypothetical protein ACYTEQ_11535 [Planctomycetota bacterium]|jgi:hypothetical protein
MVEYILKAVDYILKLIPSFIPPIDVQVEALCYQSVKNDPDEILQIVTSCPSCYLAELLLVNRTALVVFFKDVSLVIGQDKFYKPSKDVTKIRLEPHQPLRISIAFGVSDEDTSPEDGTYELRIIPTSGRQTSVKGRFPVGND